MGGWLGDLLLAFMYIYTHLVVYRCEVCMGHFMTQTSNNASTCGCQTPLIPRSSLSPGSLEVAVASFTIDSFITWGHT